MRFFARLAPAARAQHAVQPALPPRFAGPSAGVREIDAELPAAPHSAISLDVPEPERREPGEASRAAPRDDAPERALRTRGEASDAPQPANAHGAARAPPLAPSLPAAMVIPPAAPVPDAARARPAERAQRRRNDASPARPQRDDASAPLTPRHPLTALALAQRVQPAKSEPTVVHVTIDRIDVRAPAASKPPRAAAKPRAAPAMSLADYLRGGKP